MPKGKKEDINGLQDRQRRNLEKYGDLERQSYAEGNYLHFGLEGEYPSLLDIEGTAELLSPFGRGIFSYGASMDRPITRAVDLIPADTHICDFCSRPLLGGQYDRLVDGRERCAMCTRTVVRRPKEVRILFQTVKRQMEISFGIKFLNNIQVSVVSSRKLQKELGTTFVPTSGFDSRPLGFAKVKRGHQVLWLENGCPRSMIMSTTAHELTHVWQNQNEYFLELQSKVDRETYLLIVEGMATWAEVQCLKLAHEDDYAQVLADHYNRSDDEYGYGFRLYVQRYGFSECGFIARDTPFNHPEGPL